LIALVPREPHSISRTQVKKSTPPTATGTPPTDPYRLRYAALHDTVALMSQKLA